MFDLFLSGSRPGPNTRRDFAWFAGLLIFPLPFILIILWVNPASQMGSLVLMCGLASVLAVVLFRYGQIRADNQLRTRQLDELNQFGSRMATALETGDLLSELCKTAVSLSGCRSSAVFLYNLEQGKLQLQAAYRLGEDFQSENRSFPFLPNGRAQCLSLGRPVFIQDVTRENLESEYFVSLQRQGIGAVGDFPLRSPDGPIGYLSTYYEGVHPFESDEIRLMELISAQAAISISNARLHERTDLALSRRIHQLSILETMGRQLAEVIESDRLFEMIIDYAVEFTDANWGSIGLLDLMAQRINIKAWRGYSGYPSYFSVKDGLPGRAIQSQGAVNSKDVLAEKGYIDFTRGVARSHLSVPMLHASKVLGVISLESANSSAFTDADVMFISQLATQAAVATELYQSVQTRELITETLVHDIRSPISAVLGALEVIEDASGEPEVELAPGIGEAVIGHSVIDPAASTPSAITEGVITYGAIIPAVRSPAVRSPPVNNPAIIRQGVQVARQGAIRVLNLIESLLDIARFQSGKIELVRESVDLQALVSDLLRSFELQSQEYGVFLCSNLPVDLPRMVIDKGKITRVLSNLVDNALKFSPSGSQVCVDGKLADNEGILIQVVDQGPGVPAEYREKIFERFEQIPGLQARRRGTGLGLTFCRLAVEAHGGHIWVEPNPAGGSSFSLTLPLIAP